MKNVRTRFAPSPTGYLHVGSLKTALFVYLLAKSMDGKAILRIEDTDQKRKVEGAVEKLIEILDWVGISFDEGPGLGGDYGPYIQTQRLEIYKNHIDELLAKKKAYYCFCTPERLDKMRAEQQKMKLPPRYDRKCRDLSQAEIEKKLKNQEKYVIRQKMPLTGIIKVYDELRGEIKFNAKELEDHVLLKSNGVPTYHLASVVDDRLMEISHVVRGEEWIPSLPKNILLYQAFNWTPPKFIHMPLTLNKGGGKLSKRQGDVAVEDYKTKGYLPEAIINFSVLLGWSPYGKISDDKKSGDKFSEIFSLKELEKAFNYKKIGTSGAVFDIEKLDYINGYYIRKKPLDELVDLCMPFLKKNLKKTTDKKRQTGKYIKKVVAIEQERLKILSEIGELTEFFFSDKLEYSQDLLLWKKMELKSVKSNLEKIIELLEKIPEQNWTNDSIEDSIYTYLKAKELKVGEYLWPMRVALTGRKASPGPYDVAEILGKSECLRRIKNAIDLI
ncbi:glutamate--tRNA ligase [Candidatus Falkowbacteria bacterium]|nr:MAG: glutamate--tRNA ligase [Candidatus Falkowbacteria bacterium]